jgi:hypothetical protein
MNNSMSDLLYAVADDIVGYLPRLFGGLVLVAAGWFLAWGAKRITVQLAGVLRVDRLLRSSRWGRGFARADARHALYEAVGSGVAVVTFLVLLNAALATMRITVLSDLLQKGVWFIPRLITALLITGLGALVSEYAAAAVQRALLAERVPRATLMARAVRSVLLLFFAAMALTELNIARQVVLVGFTTVIITLCALIVLITAMGGKVLANRVVEGLDRET